MQAKGYDLEFYRSTYSVAVFGSRAASCHRPNSDWDIVVLGPSQVSDRGQGLDFLMEDPPRDPYWYHRDLAFHLSGYAVWISGAPNWDPAKLEWEAAYARKLKRVREIALSLGHYGAGLSTFRGRYWMNKCLHEAGRAILLKQRRPISPTALLPKVGHSELRDLEVSRVFLDRFSELNQP